MVKELKKYDFDGCIKDELLRKIPASKEKAEGSIKTAFKWLEESEKNIQIEAFRSSLVSSYLAMFHSSRAILFLDGYREKSHYCIARYIEEKYAKNGLIEQKFIELLDYYRDLRHNDQYSTSFTATKEDAESALQKAKEFVERMNKLFDDMIK